MGQVWLDRRYRDESQAGDFAAGSASDPFIDLYRQVANDLLAAYERQQAATLAQLPTVALLRQARLLAPAAFEGYLVDEDAVVTLRRAPAEDDPMMARVQRIRDQDASRLSTARTMRSVSPSAIVQAPVAPSRQWSKPTMRSSGAKSSSRTWRTWRGASITRYSRRSWKPVAAYTG